MAARAFGQRALRASIAIGARPARQRRAQRAAVEDPERAGRALVPDLVAGERLGGDDGDAIARVVTAAKSICHLGVAQGGAPERRLADDVAELGPAARVEVAPVAEQEVELALGAQLAAELARSARHSRRRSRGIAAGNGARSCSSIQQKACSLSVSPIGCSDVQPARFDARQRAVVGEDPVPPPEHALERVGVLERGRPRVFLRTWAIASSVLMGFWRMNSASGLWQAGRGSRKLRANSPS